MNPCRIHTQEHHHDSNLVVYCYTFDQLLALIFTDQFAGIRVICTRSSSSISAVDVSMVMILTSIVRLSLVPCKMFLIHIKHDEFHRNFKFTCQEEVPYHHLPYWWEHCDPDMSQGLGLHLAMQVNHQDWRGH